MKRLFVGEDDDQPRKRLQLSNGEINKAHKGYGNDQPRNNGEILRLPTSTDKKNITLPPQPPPIKTYEGFVRVKTSYDYYEDISFGPNEKFNEDTFLFDFVKSVPGHLHYDKNEYERVFMISWVTSVLCFQVKDMKSTKIGTLFRRACFATWEILQIDCVVVKLPRFRTPQFCDRPPQPFRGPNDDDDDSGYLTE